MSEDNNRVNTIIGEVAGIAGIPVQQLIYIVPFAVFLLPFFFRNPLPTFFLFATAVTGWLILSWDDPAGFFETWVSAKKLYAAEEEVVFNKAGIPKPNQPRQKTVQLRLKGKRITMTRIESQFELLTYGEIRLEDLWIGYYLSQKGPRLMFTFGYELDGFDPSMTTDQARLQLAAMNAAISKLPYSVSLKGYDDLFCNATAYLEMQQKLRALPGITSLALGLYPALPSKAE